MAQMPSATLVRGGYSGIPARQDGWRSAAWQGGRLLLFLWLGLGGASVGFSGDFGRSIREDEFQAITGPGMRRPTMPRSFEPPPRRYVQQLSPLAPQVEQGYQLLVQKVQGVPQQCQQRFRQQGTSLDDILLKGPALPTLILHFAPSNIAARYVHDPKEPHIWVNSHWLKKERPGTCQIASALLHELIHHAREDADDTEDLAFQKDCRNGCLDPGRFR